MFHLSFFLWVKISGSITTLPPKPSLHEHIVFMAYSFPFSKYPPLCQIKNFVGPKWADTRSKLKVKKSFLGEDIKLKETQRGPLGGPSRVHLRGIKLFSVGGRNFQNIKPKDIQRGPLGDHLKDDPASGDKPLVITQHNSVWSGKRSMHNIH